MQTPFLSLPHIPLLLWAFLLAVHLLLSFLVAFSFGRERILGFPCSFLLCLLLTAPLGCVVILCFQTNAQRQRFEDRAQRAADPFTREDYLLRLGVHKRCGMISKADYEMEKKRILASTPKAAKHGIITQKVWEQQHG